jgi:hypothetical protein
MQVVDGLIGSTTPLEGAIYYDDEEDNDISSYENKNVSKESSLVTTESTTTDVLPVRNEQNEFVTEATVTSPSHTTVINGFVLPQTVRNFFKRPSFNTVDSDGIETVRTSEQKQLEAKTTTQRTDDVVDMSTIISLGTTELIPEEETKLSFDPSTMSPILLSVEVSQATKSLAEKSVQPIVESLLEKNNGTATTETTIKSQGHDTTEAEKTTNVKSFIDSTNGVAMTEQTNTETYVTIEDIESAQDRTKSLEEKTPTTESSTENQEIETTESLSMTQNNGTKQGDIEPESLEDIKKEDEDDIAPVKKEEKRPASTSPVSDLLNGIYRLISVSHCFLCYLERKA